MVIRDEHPEDIAAIRRINELAFGQPAEADLVDALRAAGAVTLSLVAVDDDGTVIGHILFSPVTIASEQGRSEAVGLAPMAVLPEAQGRLVGNALVHFGLERLHAAGHQAVVVLGHPAYYPRFGFRRASALGLRWDHDAPDEAFMALELVPGALHGRAGVVSFRPEFEGV